MDQDIGLGWTGLEIGKGRQKVSQSLESPHAGMVKSQRAIWARMLSSRKQHRADTD